MKFGQLFGIIAGAFALERFRVNGAFFDFDGCVIGDHAGEHQRQNDLVIQCELENHDDGHDRGMRRRG